MLVHAKQTTVLAKAFECYGKLATEISELSKRIEILKTLQKPHKKVITACVRCNEGQVICGPWKAMVVPVKERHQSAYEYIHISGGKSE